MDIPLDLSRARSCGWDELRKLDPRMYARRVDGVVSMLADDYWDVRYEALLTLRQLEPPRLAQHAGAIAARLEDDEDDVRREALATLSKLEPPTLAQHAGAVVARLEDSHLLVREMAMETLGKLNPAALAQHAGAVAATLEDSDMFVRITALQTLRKLNPAALAHHAGALAARLEDSDIRVREQALETLRKVPRFVTRGVDFTSSALRSRLLGRLAWYRCRLRLRVERLALYWYALPYRPNGPGHARDVEAWGRMNGNRDQSASKTPSTRKSKRQKKATGAPTVGGTS